MEDTKTERHPFRFLFKLLLFVGAMSAITRVVASKKKEYYGLTESEARSKFESKLGPRIGEEKASEVADQVIPRLKDKGIFKPDPVEEAVEQVKHATSAAAESVKEAADTTADKVTEAVDEVEKKID
jgi:hypothetical protein